MAQTRSLRRGARKPFSVLAQHHDELGFQGIDRGRCRFDGFEEDAGNDPADDLRALDGGSIERLGDSLGGIGGRVAVGPESGHQYRRHRLDLVKWSRSSLHVRSSAETAQESAPSFLVHVESRCARGRRKAHRLECEGRGELV